MRLAVSVVFVCLVLPLAVAGAQDKKYFKWTDEDGVTHYGDNVPPEYSDKPKEVLNDQGVIIDHVEGKKTEEQLEQERLEKELETQRELQRRADQALLNTYISVDEIIMHRDRRLELYQSQAKVTELYLRNSRRQLESLQRERLRFKPYSSDPNAPTIDTELLQDISDTEAMIKRLEQNLAKYLESQEQTIQAFAGDIARFKKLKAIDD